MNLIELGFKPPFQLSGDSVIDSEGKYVCGVYGNKLPVLSVITDALNKAYPLDAQEATGALEVTADYTPSRKERFILAIITGYLSNRQFDNATNAWIAERASLDADEMIEQLDKGSKDERE